MNHHTPNRLLTADLHLTDHSQDEYRWGVFETLAKVALENRVSEIIIAGDALDRKDRHSATLVNRVISSLEFLVDEADVDVVIIEGNHDAPLSGIPYWSFLSSLSRVEYVTEPTFDMRNETWLLPFAANPVNDWKELNLGQGKFIFMHQTVAGSLIERDFVLPSGQTLPLLPRGIPILSGDVHRPQQVGPITYIGAPYPVKFSENWKNRFILLKGQEIVPILIPSIKRSIIDISDIKDLELLDQPLSHALYGKFKEGDQIRVRFKLSPDKLSMWPEQESKIAEWAEKRKITLVSTEAILDSGIRAVGDEKIDVLELLKPEDVIKNFATDEKLDEEVVDFGVSILKELQ